MNISIWEKNFLNRADIVVLGNGLVGMQTALRLKEKFPHRQVWVLDRSPMGLGASMRNAGFVCFGSIGEILDDEVRMGPERALNLFERRFKGARQLIEEFGETVTGYEKTGGYEVFTKAQMHEAEQILSSVNRINNQTSHLHKEGFFKTVNAAKLGMNVIQEAVYSPEEGALQTHLLYAAVRKKTVESGVEIMSGLCVTTVENAATKGHWIIQTAEGYVISAKILVLCTNGFTKQFVSDAVVEPARGQVVVTSQIPGLPWRGIMHADKGYYYFRNLGTRILLGGARNLDFQTEKTTKIGLNERISTALIDFLKEIVIPGQEFTIDHQWSGIMGMAVERDPVITRVEEGLYAVYRMGGMGLALSSPVSRELAAMVE